MRSVLQAAEILLNGNPYQSGKTRNLSEGVFYLILPVADENVSQI